MDEYIKRDKALAETWKEPRYTDVMNVLTEIRDRIRSLPSEDVQPVRWIPCSERLPRTNGVYNVTRKISDGFECRNISDACYYDGANTWHDDTRVNHERRYLTDVIAWKPLPEPYQEGADNG